VDVKTPAARSDEEPRSNVPAGMEFHSATCARRVSEVPMTLRAVHLPLPRRACCEVSRIHECMWGAGGCDGVRADTAHHRGSWHSFEDSGLNRAPTSLPAKLSARHQHKKFIQTRYSVAQSCDVAETGPRQTCWHVACHLQATSSFGYLLNTSTSLSGVRQ
jgi:hypothetical protein